LAEDHPKMQGPDPFSDIRHFYRQLDRLLPHPPQANPCGTCGECCKYLFYLAGYEFAYLARCVKEATGEIPVAFRVSRNSGEDNRLGGAYAGCPLYRPGQGCLGYQGRPYACRVMGAWWPVTTLPYEECIYANPRIYSRLEDLPLWDDYVGILRRHPSLPGYLDHP